MVRRLCRSMINEGSYVVLLRHRSFSFCSVLAAFKSRTIKSRRLWTNVNHGEISLCVFVFYCGRNETIAPHWVIWPCGLRRAWPKPSERCSVYSDTLRQPASYTCDAAWPSTRFPLGRTRHTARHNSNSTSYPPSFIRLGLSLPHVFRSPSCRAAPACSRRYSNKP